VAASSTSTRRRRRNAGATITVAPPTGTVATALTASAARTGQLGSAVNNQRTPQWQLDALAYYDQIGAVRYASQFWARGLSKIRFYVAERGEDGELEESTDEQAIEVFDRVQDPTGGRVGLTTSYGHLRFLTGECYLIWMPETDDEPESWEVVSTLELRKLSRRGGRETWHRIEAPGLNPQELVEAEDDAFEPMANEVIVYRLWRRHPAYSKMADAPMRSVLADCEEIVRCTHTINARLISRLSGPGIFAIPQSWKVKPLTQVAGEEQPEADPFQTRLTQAMVTAIGTPGSAESVAPIIVRVPDESTASAHLYKIWDPNEVIREIDLREKAVHRFSVGIDAPPAKVEGIEDSNHWNAWAIDKEGMEHLTPVATDFANDLSGAYFRPALRKLREDWDRFVIWFDAAAAVSNPDAFADAMLMYKERIVGKAYVREAGNATDDDKMTDEELEEALFVATSQRVDVEGGALAPPEPVPAPLRDGPPTGEDTEQDMPDEPDEPVDAVASRNGTSDLALMVMAQAELALEEIRSRIGLKVRNHLAGGRCTECVDRVQRVPAQLIVSELGEQCIRDNDVDLAAYADNAGALFGHVLERRGATYAQSRALQEVLEVHAVATIYEVAPRLPTGFAGRVKLLEAA
jgi:hypothetical protein